MNINTDQLLQNFLPLAVSYGTKILMALAIFIIGRFVIRLFSNFLTKVMTERGVDPMIVGFVASIVFWAMFAFVIIAALAQIGIQTASFVAILGAAGLAVGLALQGSLANFAAGVLLIIFRPFKTGDFIEAAGQSGSVSDIKIFSISLTTPDNKEIIIPNASVMGGSIVNYTTKPTRRVDLLVGVSYNADLAQTKKILEDIVSSNDKVLQEGNNLVAVSELADSSVNLVVRAWAKTEDYWGVYFAMTEEVKLKLDAANIEIPYPQMDIHLPAKDA